MVFYGFTRFSFAFEAKMPLAPSAFIDFGVAFFLIMMTFVQFSMIYDFIVGFPNNFYIADGCCTAVFCGVLHFQKKRL
jgi:hypothetical protein